VEHVGIDLGARLSQVCVRSPEGTVLEERRVETAELQKYLLGRPTSRVVVETCTEAFKVADEALELGHEVRVVPASLVRSLGVGARRLKTDRRDAQVLSEVSARIELPSVHIPSTRSRTRKSENGMREALVEARTKLINTVRAWMRGQGKRVGTGQAESLPKAGTRDVERTAPRLRGTAARCGRAVIGSHPSGGPRARRAGEAGRGLSAADERTWSGADHGASVCSGGRQRDSFLDGAPSCVVLGARPRGELQLRPCPTDRDHQGGFGRAAAGARAGRLVRASNERPAPDGALGGRGSETTGQVCLHVGAGSKDRGDHVRHLARRHDLRPKARGVDAVASEEKDRALPARCDDCPEAVIAALPRAQRELVVAIATRQRTFTYAAVGEP
jgi:hypothetical protein